MDKDIPQEIKSLYNTMDEIQRLYEKANKADAKIKEKAIQCDKTIHELNMIIELGNLNAAELIRATMKLKEMLQLRRHYHDYAVRANNGFVSKVRGAVKTFETYKERKVNRQYTGRVLPFVIKGVA